jgi:TRAP-type C4-dicarboxylate transport system permease large subunit
MPRRGTAVKPKLLRSGPCAVLYSMLVGWVDGELTLKSLYEALMEGIAIILIAVPGLLPAMKAIGVDPVHFGVFLTVNVMIGLLTPPVGIAVYIASNQSGAPVAEGFRKTAPFIIPLIVTLLLITYVPETVLFLPRLLFK